MPKPDPRFEAALSEMPDLFTKKDLAAVVEKSLGREINPGTVWVAVERLLKAGKIVVAEPKNGGKVAVYRRVDQPKEGVAA